MCDLSDLDMLKYEIYIIPDRNKKEQRKEWNLTINAIVFIIN